MENNKKHSQEYLGEARDYWWNDDFLCLLAKRLNLSECTTLVDIGCGKGYLAYMFAPYLNSNAKVYGFDKEQQWIDDAIVRTKTFSNTNDVNFYFQVGDAYKIPVENSLSDITVCQTLLIHLNNPIAAINEMKRITRDGGLVVAIEPNNIINSLVADSLSDDDINDKVELLEIQLRIELGKKLLGEGYNSVGDLIPQMFKESGLKDIQVWLCDKPLSIIPPYDTREKILRVQETLTWLEREEVYLDYQGQLRYFLGGGGTEEKFNNHWIKTKTKMERLKSALENETYISSGGSIMYIVAGRK
ncbi:MAG TPA: methyltransferase domain-containing protein [Candidatus Deferrimicrobium sp.]|nr:methyltransferase domain-containing protein [Candidatus Deferrimicrobium sp.]